jgi:hypothetical protein
MDGQWTPFSKYVTLASGASKDYYPANNTSFFMHKLLEPIKCDETLPLEVALTDLWYHPKARPGKTIFGHEQGDDAISMVRRFKAEIFVHRKEGERYEQILNDSNESFGKYFPTLKLELGVKEDKSAWFTMKNGDKKKTLEIRPRSYAEAMGFDVNVFPPGVENKGKFSISQTLLNLIDVATPLAYQIYHEEKQVATVKEPTDKSVSGLIGRMNDAVSGKGIKFSYNGNELEVDGLYATGYYVRLSPLLEKIFGLVPPCWFDWEKESSQSNASIDLGLSSNHLVVLADVVDPAYFGN